jgi:hypothetical protein
VAVGGSACAAVPSTVATAAASNLEEEFIMFPRI